MKGISKQTKYEKNLLSITYRKLPVQQSLERQQHQTEKHVTIMYIHT
jgi:hypothetical protein